MSPMLSDQSPGGRPQRFRHRRFLFNCCNSLAGEAGGMDRADFTLPEDNLEPESHESFHRACAHHEFLY